MESKQFLEEFQAGRRERTAGYQYFVPNPINRQWKWKDAQLNTLLEKASRKIGELNSFARLVPNIDLFIQLHVMKEAVISSRIEGTRTNIDEALLTEEDIRQSGSYLYTKRLSIRLQRSAPLSHLSL